MTDTVTVEEAESPDLHRTIVRIVSGGIGEGIARLMKVASQLEEADEEEIGTVGPINANPNLMALIGLASELPELTRGATNAASRMAYPVVRVAGVTVDTVSYLLEITGIKAFWSDLSEPARTAITEELERLSQVGTGEYARGRVLAAYAFEQSVEGIVGLLSESEELGDLVREQALGVTGGAVQEVRETGAAADALTEAIFRRVFRRESRPLPPKPAEEP
mgnify:CR=1 FL=1